MLLDEKAQNCENVASHRIKSIILVQIPPSELSAHVAWWCHDCINDPNQGLPFSLPLAMTLQFQPPRGWIRFSPLPTLSYFLTLSNRAWLKGHRGCWHQASGGSDLGFSNGSVVRSPLPRQETRVQSLVREDPTRRRAPKPECRSSHWAHAPWSLRPAAKASTVRAVPPATGEEAHPCSQRGGPPLQPEKSPVRQQRPSKAETSK